ncbi:MAG: hypothetical protein ACLTDV_03705 [Eubacterium sp.]
MDFENEKALVDDHILDSFDILQIISDISDEFDIVIPAAYVKPENFNSAEALLENDPGIARINTLRKRLEIVKRNVAIKDGTFLFLYKK